MTIALKLAEFAAQTRYEDIPPPALDYAAMLISSTLASAAMGRDLPAPKLVREFMTQRGGTPEASIWFGEGRKLPLAMAARINAMMSDAAASDDSDLRNIMHPGTPLVAAALATGEMTAASGREVVRAVTLGYDVVSRINGAVVPGLLWEKGFHGCVVAIFGSAVATGLLLKLSAGELAHAIGLAATSIGGLVAASATSRAREHHASLAACLGVEAAQLAQRGYEAEPGVLEHPRGFFVVYGQDAHESGRVSRVTSGLGKDWMILRELALKLVPGAHPLHAIAEAAIGAAEDGNISAEDIAQIIVTRPDSRQLYGSRHPTDLVGMAHSPYYFAAAGAADRDFTWVHATTERIMDPRIRRLLDLVRLAEGPLENSEDYRHGAEVTIVTESGKRATRYVRAPRGAAITGVGWPEVHAKFDALVPLSGLPPARHKEVRRFLDNFSDQPDVRKLMSLMS